MHLARALDRGVPGLKLAAASARDHAKAAANVAGFKHPPRIVSNAELAACDIVVEAAPAAVFEEIATAAIEAGRIFVPSSVGALLPRMHLVEKARATGARIIVVGVCMEPDGIEPFFGIVKQLSLHFVLAYNAQEFAATLGILALLVPFVRGRAELAAAATAGSVALLASPLPMKLGLVCGAVAGIAAGAFSERMLARSKP
jgi:hypothetical protein